jgi:MYXO-CTERM domain-containing protein
VFLPLDAGVDGGVTDDAGAPDDPDGGIPPYAPRPKGSTVGGCSVGQGAHGGWLPMLIGLLGLLALAIRRPS